ncbi:hypothetical protein LMIY3S_05574 [Labrys miyagiensis]
MLKSTLGKWWVYRILAVLVIVAGFSISRDLAAYENGGSAMVNHYLFRLT